MVKSFMNKNFLLNSETAVILFHKYAKDLPIIDYHCHLNSKEIAEDKVYSNITEIWLYGDHYKWRLMRTNGVPEKYITGDATDKEKFLKWAETIPYCLGNPIYHWTHMELRKYFGINKLLSKDTAEEIWNICNEKLKSGELSAKKIIKMSGVEAICTTDDPADPLEYHENIKVNGFGTAVLPTFRPDKYINIEKDTFYQVLKKIEAVVNYKILSLDDMKNILKSRIQYFDDLGTRISDHALDPIVYEDASEDEVAIIFQKAIIMKDLSVTEINKYKTHILKFLAMEYKKLNWVMQIHMGVLRNNNSKMLKKLGPDTGFDSIGDYQYAESLSQFMNSLEYTNELPKTILYCLNPRDNEVLATIAGCFQGAEIPGKIQFGSAWWFNDQLDGMRKQIVTLANYGLLSRFVGMLTDSRSFLSYTRHEYFRRLLCDIVGGWVENGEIPNDMDLVGDMIKNICYYNAKNYFKLS